MTLKYTGHLQREALYDYTPTSASSSLAIVFVHGYKGYKDWGAWNHLASQLAKTGHSVYKMNLSHNGTTLDQPTTFSDLEAFGNGGYWSDYNDIDAFLTHLMEKEKVEQFILIGHSRGGGEVALFAKDPRVKQIHCIAPIASIEKRFPSGEALENWEKEGVYYRENGRTQQSMPHYFSQYNDFIEHKDQLDIEQAVTRSKVDLFVYHGDQDESVSLTDGVSIAKWGNGHYHNIQGANHTFGISEPWNSQTFPAHFEELISLLKRNIITH